MLGPFATDGERLYGWWLGHDEEGKAVASPGALSLDTGEVLFAVPLQGLEPSGAAGPVVYDGVVYFPDRYGNVTAYAVDEFGPDWGGPLWRTLQLPPNPFMDIGISPGFDTPSPSAELVVNDDGVFVVRASKTIVKLDRMTGEELASINLIDLLRGDIGPVSIQAVGNKLVVSAQHDQGASDEYAGPMSVLVLGTTSLDAFARTDMSEVRSNMVATLEWIYVAGRIDPQAPVEIFRINPVTGEISKPFADFGVPAHGWIGLSLSGTTLMATTSTGLYGFIDIESQSVIVSNVLKTADDGTLFYPYQLSPFQLSGQNPVALTSTGNILLIGD